MNNRFDHPESVYHATEIRVDPGPPRMFASPETSTWAVMLGSGKPEPTLYRNGPGGAVIANDTPYLIDAGEGIWRGIAKAATAHNGKLIEALAPNKLTRLFLTHLHSDHTVGLPSLLLLPWTCGKTKPLEIYGPKGTKNLVEKLLEAYVSDIDERVYGPEQKDNTGWRAIVHEILEPGPVYFDENLTVEAFHHAHGGFKQNFGYRFTTSDRTIVWAGDGVASASYLEAARNADVLFSDISPAIDKLGDTPWRASNKELSKMFHIQSQQLAEIAVQANVKVLALHHEQNYSEPYDLEALVKEVKQIYAGTVISARDGDVF